jgi:1,2-diacylglycerol 3-alpha-glucosyltransferase
VKILHLCLAMPFYDNFSYQENILPKYHSKLGFETFVIASTLNIINNTSASKIESGSYNINGHEVRRLNYKYAAIGSRMRIYKNLFQNIIDISPDIIFIHGCQFCDIKAVIKYKKKNPNTTIYIDNHADYINSGKNIISKYILHKLIWKHFAKAIEPITDRFYGVLPIRCDFLKQMYNISQDKIELLVMGADDDCIKLSQKTEIRNNIRKSLGIKADDFVLICGGKIDKRKNIDLLIKAVSELKSNIKLIIFGTPTDEMKVDIENLSQNESIINIGWLASEEVYNFFIASDLGFFPGTHSVLWEQAVGCGLPCVFKKWYGIQHVDVGGNCLFIDEVNIKTIKDLIVEIYNNQELYIRMKNISLQKGICKFSYSEISKKCIKYGEERLL